LLALSLSLWSAPTFAQNIENPVYVDDSPTAADAISQARARLNTDDASEAVRLLQTVLTKQGDRLLRSPDDPDLFFTVRQRINQEIRATPALLDRYRALENPVAQALLEKGQESAVASDHLLTTAGFDAVARLAERRFESAQFNSAWRTLLLLDNHPDRTGERAKRAVRLLSRIAPYTDAPGANELFKRWSAQLGQSAVTQSQVATPDLNIGRSTLDPGPSITLDDLVSRPLATQPIPSPVVRAQARSRARSNPRAAVQRTPLNYILPTVTKNLIFLNDGHTLSAWERFTLLPVWRTEYAQSTDPSASVQSTSGRNAIEDLDTVAVSGRWAVAVGGIAARGLRVDDEALHAVDSVTGAHRWTVTLADLDSTLAEGSFRGAPIIDQGVVVVGVVKSIKERRLLSFHMVGLDLYSGQLLWVRPLGSSGTLPYGAIAKIADFPTEHDGLIYQIDSLGFLAALEPVTGAVQWLRRLPLKNLLTTVRRTWQGGSVVVHAGELYAISPSGRNVISLDASTGAILDTRSTVDFHNPFYLLQAKHHLIAVGDNRISSLRFSDFDNHDVAPVVILDARSSPIDGRVAVAGDRILAPTRQGVRIASAIASDPSQATLASLDHSGNLVALESELVVADESDLHTYLLWDVAERVLTQRMVATPDDPAPAATFVDLAYRAGRTQRLLPAVDAALDAIARNPLDDHNRQVRTRLFNTLWSIAADTPKRDDDKPLPHDLQGELIDRLGRTASSPPQRVRFLLAQGSFYEKSEQPIPAVDSFQQILDNKALAHAHFDSGGVVAHADLEATKNLKRLIRRFGPGAYSVYEAQADRALVSLTNSQDPADYADLARRYPVSATAARAWLTAAKLYKQQGRIRRVLAALSDGLDAADSALLDNRALVGELAGQLVTSLIDADRLESAASTLATIRQQRPTLTLTRQGETLAINQLESQLSSLLSEAHRLPTVGAPDQSPPTQLLVGWRIERPLLGANDHTSTESIVLRSDRSIALWITNPTTGLHKMWETPLAAGSALIASTWNAVVVVEPGVGGQTLARLDRATGALVWRTKPLDDTLPLDDTARIGTFLAIDHRTLAVVRADGASSAFDLETGRTLWSSKQVLPIVADIAADAETLLVVGSHNAPNPQVPGLEPNPAMLALDLRTGKVIKEYALDAIGLPRWARLTPDALAIVGGDMGVLAYDLLRDRSVWTADDLAGVRTIDAWVLPNRIIILDADAGLWQIGLGQDRPASTALDTQNKLARTVLLNQRIGYSAQGDNVAFSSFDGVLVFDHDGDVIGLDRRGDDQTVLAAAFGAKHMVTVSSSPAFLDAGATWHDLYLFTSPSGAVEQRRLIELDAAPDDLALLDGRILITAGKATLVVDAPPTD